MRAASFALPVAAIVVGACSSAPEPSDEPVGRASSAIINGQVDTTHEAVVVVVSGDGTHIDGLCTGTIVKVDTARNIGWVATAAHCVESAPLYVLQCADFGTGPCLSYETVDFRFEPSYNGQVGAANDIAMIRVAGVDGSTPTIPLVTAPDGLTTGSAVVSVGYGRTSGVVSSNPNDQNTKRHSVSKTISQIQGNGALLVYNQSTSGICQGDSGGPVISSAGGGERVVGIHSFVSGSQAQIRACSGTGVSVRVTAGASFWNGELGKALPAEDCALCQKVANSGNGQCATVLRNCIADKANCGGFLECLNKGTSRANCLKQFPKAEGPLNAVANCTCTQACADKCAGNLDCAQVPKCGYKLPAGDCSTCLESSCCDETLDCSADGTCYVCLKTKDAAEECAGNASRKKMATCAATKCATECAGSGIETGAEPEPEGEGTPEGGGGGTTVTTTESCAAAPGARGGFGAFVLAGLALAAGARRRRR
ncbi:MAG: S1 family peptidase [Labilithrix sp.]|nr:S1 family peptidase [Labilithrix sp.]